MFWLTEYMPKDDHTKHPEEVCGETICEISALNETYEDRDAEIGGE